MKPFNVFPYDSNIHFMRLRWVSLAIAALLMFGSFGAMLYNTFAGGHFNVPRNIKIAAGLIGIALVFQKLLGFNLPLY